MMEQGETRELLLATLLMAGAVALGAGVGYAVGRQTADAAPGLRLKDLAGQAHIQPPTALAHLRKMEAEGLVRRIQAKEGPRYQARPHASIEWTDTARRLHDQWTSSVPIDWRFPLVSRVPDEPAQHFLLEWLDRAEARSLLPPSISRFEPVQDPVRLLVAVYGSRARGDARAKADLDLLLITSRPWKGSRELVGLAHEVGLDHGMSIQAQDMTRDQIDSLPEGFRDNLRREGRTVWLNDPLASLLEHPLERGHAA